MHRARSKDTARTAGGLRGAARPPLVVRTRDGGQVEFDARRIGQAIEAAFRADGGLEPEQPLPHGTMREIERLTAAVTDRCFDRNAGGEGLDVERIQDLVEGELMRAIHVGVARRYILYREERRRARAFRAAAGGGEPAEVAGLSVVKRDGRREPLDPRKLSRRLRSACRGLDDRVSLPALLDDTVRQLFDGMETREIERALAGVVQARTERDPAYAAVQARLLLHGLYKSALPRGCFATLAETQRTTFPAAVRRGAARGLYNPALAAFDLERLGLALQPDRDYALGLDDLRRLREHALAEDEGRVVETPQFFLLRAAMGLALPEGGRRDARALAWYEALSTLGFVPAAPAVLAAGRSPPPR